ncbi:MAG TPA: hypothetical protein VGB59_05235 [Allosphingosinicella sp.]|jgi:hypothetical protein
MSPTVKILIGLLLALLAGWLSHGPLGRGEALVSSLERQAQAAIAPAELSGIQVRLGRDPLSRAATLSGNANDIQRDGMGSQKGINDYVQEVEGVSGLRWTDQSGSSGGFPLLAETLILCAAGYLIGLGLGWLLFGRRRREGFA